MAADSPPAPSAAPAAPVRWGWVLPAVQAGTFALAVAVFVAVAVKLIAFASAGTPVPAPVAASEPPEWSDARDYQAKFYRYQQIETMRQSARHTELANGADVRQIERVTVLTTCGLLSGVGTVFVALALLLGAARAEAAGPDPGPLGRAARWAPGTLALVCAALIITVSAAQTNLAPVQPTTAPGGAYPTVQSTGFAVPPATAW